jgi:hypothetical protein
LRLSIFGDGKGRCDVHVHAHIQNDNWNQQILSFRIKLNHRHAFANCGQIQLKQLFHAMVSIKVCVSVRVPRRFGGKEKPTPTPKIKHPGGRSTTRGPFPNPSKH